MAIELSYQGNAGVDDMGAFNVRLYQMWRGDNLFRVYPADGTLYFIRVGGSKQQNAAIGAQFGLIGALAIYFTRKRAKRKEQETLNQIAGSDPRSLLASHKYNFALPAMELAKATILPPAALSGTGGRVELIGVDGKKRKGSFDDVDNMRAGIEHLSAALGTKLDVRAEFDEAKKKYRKPTR